MKQHLKNMIKSYEDQQQLGTLEQPRFDHTTTLNPGNDTQQFNDQQLTYDNTKQYAAAKQPGKSAAPLEAKVHDMEERQKIFEEEIIKRVKEIQNYAKTLHMHLKKLQQSHVKKGEELQAAKEQIMQFKEGANQQNSGPGEQQISEIVDKQIKALDNEIILQLEHTEQKLVKDYDSKFQRQSKALLNELQLKCDSVKEEVIQTLMEEIQSNFKADIMKQVTERVKEAGKGQERVISDLRDLLKEKTLALEEQHQLFQKECSARQDKLSKQVKESQVSTDDMINTMGENLRQEIDQARKKSQRDFKAELDSRQLISASELNDQLAEFDSRLLQAQASLGAKLQDSGSSVRDSNLSGRVEALELLAREHEKDLESTGKSLRQSEDQMRSIQEAYLQLKSHQSSQSLSMGERFDLLQEELNELKKENEERFEAIDQNLLQIQRQTPQNVDPSKIIQDVLEQVQPDFDNLKDTQGELQQQVDVLKQQLNSKLLRSELQEVKSDIDDELRTLEKLMKKHEDLISVVEHKTSQNGEQLLKVEQSLDATTQHSQEALEDLKESLESKVNQLSQDIQSKTNDLYDEIQELQTQMQEMPASKKEESTPERKSKPDLLTAVKANLEEQIHELDSRVKLMAVSLVSSEQLRELKGQLEDSINRIEASNNQELQEVREVLDTKQDKVAAEELRQTFDEQFDETIAKVNEIDARVSQIEEKDHKSMITEEDFKPLDSGSNTKIDELVSKLQTDIETLKFQVEGRFESLKVHSSEIDRLRLQVTQLNTTIAEHHKEDIEDLKHDVQSLRELNACLQDVAATKEEVEGQAAKTGQELAQVESKVSKLIPELNLLKVEFMKAQSQQAIDKEEHERQVGSLSERMEEISTKLKEHDESVQNLKSRVYNLEQAKPPIVQEQTRTIQAINYHATPKAYDTHSPDHRQQTLMGGFQAQNAGHFLENLSEVISSPNNFGYAHQNEGDIMMFNNRQSISSASMLSNRLMTPIQNRHFNSNLAGVAVNQPISGAAFLHQEEERKSDVRHSEEEEERKTERTPSKSSTSKKLQSSEEHSSKKPSERDLSPQQIQQSFEQSPVKSQRLINGQLEQQSDDEGQQMQEINISLESPREEEKSPERVTSLSPPANGIFINRRSSTSRDRVSQGTRHAHHIEEQSPRSGEDGMQDLNLQEEDSKEEEPVSMRQSVLEETTSINQNVEEVLGDLQNASLDVDQVPVARQDDEPEDEDNQQISGRFDREEESEEDSQQRMVLHSEENQDLNQEVQERLDGSSHAHILSPSNQNLLNQAHQHAPHHPLHHNQANHFVAFESDEDDSIQYDLVPISQSRRGSGVHAPAQPVIPSNPQLNSRNRYYESGSGGEESEEEKSEGVRAGNPLLGTEPSIEDLRQVEVSLPNQVVDDFRPPAVAEERQDSSSEGAEEYEGAPFEAEPAQNSRFEEEKGPSRILPQQISNLNQDHANQSDEENGGNPDFQQVHHETISSRRDSELSADRQSRNSRSLNLNQNNEEPEDSAYDGFDNQEEPQLPDEIAIDNNLNRAESEEEDEARVQRPDDFNPFGEVVEPHESASEFEEVKSAEGKLQEDDADDWNFEDADKEEEENGQLTSVEKTDIVVGWLFEQEILKTISAVFALKQSRRGNGPLLEFD